MFASASSRTRTAHRYEYQHIGEPIQSGVFGVRHLQAFLMFLGLTLAYALRVNMSVAIVAMTDRHAANPDFEEYDWNETTKALVLSSFFWGYVLTQVPAGQLARRCGAKVLLLWSMILCSLLTICTPWCASVGGWKVVCVLRLVEGLCQGVIFPSTHTLLSKWAPVSERAQLATYCYSGSQFGTVIMLSSSGFLASSFMGWPSIFYISGCAGGCWAVLWVFFGSNSPADYKYISIEEKEFIHSSLGSSDEDKENEQKKHLKTPWGAIFTSMPFYAIVFVHSAISERNRPGAHTSLARRLLFIYVVRLNEAFPCINNIFRKIGQWLRTDRKTQLPESKLLTRFARDMKFQVLV